VEELDALASAALFHDRLSDRGAYRESEGNHRADKLVQLENHGVGIRCAVKFAHDM
jgi:hypothetical protein